MKVGASNGVTPWHGRAGGFRATRKPPEYATGRMTSSLALVRPSALSCSTDRPCFSTVGMTARPEKEASLYIGMSVRLFCGDISFNL